jgi:hypothetical protein
MSRLVIFALACFVLGVVLLTFVDVIAPGVIALFAFIVAGVFAIADPEHL